MANILSKEFKAAELDKPIPTEPAAASKEIDVILSDTKHPYYASRDHPLRKKASSRVTQLFQVIALAQSSYIPQQPLSTDNVQLGVLAAVESDSDMKQEGTL